MTLRRCALLLFTCIAVRLAGAAEGDLGRVTALGGVPPDQIVVRGNPRHPCVNLTAAAVAAARQRVERFAWARAERDRIVKAAAVWLEHSDDYWLGFLPKPGAAYAYGFTGCPICGGRTGTWANANCSWDNPGHVKCERGHVLPDAGHPDAGKGYVAPDKRIHYFVGQFNAWVTEQWTTVALPALAQAYLLTGDERYAERGALLLDAMASIYRESTAGSWDYPSNPTSGRFARPWYQVARTLVTYVDAYDWLYHSPALDRPSRRPGMARRANIETCLLLDGARYCYERSWGGALNNGHADYLRGALAVGCLLDIPAYVDTAINGPFSIQVMLANNVDRSGLYYETAPGYAIHARHLYLTYAEPLLNLRTREYPAGFNLFDSPGLAATLTLPELQLQMRGRRPNYGDCAPAPAYLAAPKRLFDATDYEFAERLHAQATDPRKHRDYGAILRLLSGGDLAAARAAHDANWALWHAVEPDLDAVDVPGALARRIHGSWVAGMSGLAIMRDANQSALLRFGPSLNHGDPDDLGLLYYAAGYELSYDIGYGLSTTHVQVGWASSTVSHAIVTVNEKNQIARGKGSGGSLLDFADLPSVRFVDADSPLSYSTENVRTYRRAVALVAGGYLVDCFHVEGGRQHDYGFGSIGTELESFGVKDVTRAPGSLASGVAWGEKIGPDGDVIGYPNKPAWNPPPGNGYGFFFNVRHAQPAAKAWGGTWTIRNRPDTAPKDDPAATPVDAAEHVAKLRLFLVGDEAEPVYADAPGLYPRLPLSSYVLARRRGENLTSTFLGVYEPYTEGADGPAPRLRTVERLGTRAVAVHRLDGGVDLLLFGPYQGDSPLGPVVFAGRFAYVTSNRSGASKAEALGCERLELAGRPLLQGPGSVAATVKAVSAAACTVELDTDVPATVVGQTAVFSNPRWSRTSAYPVAQVSGRTLTLEARSLNLGIGRVSHRQDEHTITSDVPHEFARTALHTPTCFFDGKLAVGRSGGSTRITSVTPGSPLVIALEDAAALRDGETFEYRDLAPGDTVHISLPQVWSAPSVPARVSNPTASSPARFGSVVAASARDRSSPRPAADLHATP